MVVSADRRRLTSLRYAIVSLLLGLTTGYLTDVMPMDQINFAKKQMVARADATYFSLTVNILGELENNPAKRAAARQWLTVTAIDSMTRMDPSKNVTDEEDELLYSEEPQLKSWSLEPFQIPAAGSSVVSPLWIHVFRMVFPTSTKFVKSYVDRVCKDYASPNQVLLTAILRSLDNAELYPTQGMEAAAGLGGGLNSALSVRVDVLDDDGNEVEGLGCGKGFADGSPQSQLFMPTTCPTHSVPCSANPQQCTKAGLSEAMQKVAPWFCVCDTGYKGELSIPGFTLTDAVHFELGNEHLRYRGACTAELLFCNTQDPFPEQAEGFTTPMVLQSGAAASGVLWEVAVRVCPAGTSNTGSSECTPDPQGGGKWKPYRKCAFIPPLPPPPPDACPALDSPSLVVSASCSSCRPRDPDNPEEFSECECKPVCNSGYKHIGGPPEGDALVCDAEKYVCPVEEVLQWDDPTETCTMSSGKKVKKECCKEAWDGNRPKPLKAATCADLTSEVECLTARDTSTNLPCCFRSSGFSGGHKCASRGAQVITAATPSDACAIGPDLHIGVWKAVPSCSKVCTNNFAGKRGISEVTSCDNLLPGATCQIECREGFENGGLPELVGTRTCSADTLDFGPLPICLPEEVLVCNEADLKGPHIEVSGSCGECRAGSEYQDCAECDVKCAVGSKAVGGGDIGIKGCLSVPNPDLRIVPSCDLLSSDCTEAAQKAQDGTVTPCCYDAGSGTCMAKFSAAMTSDATCAQVNVARFEELPVCEALCPNVFLEYDHVTGAQGCGECVASDDEACDCDVACAADFERIGGGAEGKRKCLTAADASALPSFEAGALCDLPEPAPVCSVPEAPGATVSRACHACTAGSSTCECKVTCKAGYKWVGGGEEGAKTCSIAPNDAQTDAPCTALETLEECTSSFEANTNTPCCYNEAGLAAPGTDGKKQTCMPKGSSALVQAPQRQKDSALPACTPTMQGAWPDMPKCEQLVSVATWETAAGIVFNATKCEACVLSEPCDCEVKCLPGLERCGGGPEGKRQPVAGDGDSPPSLGEPPLCLPPEPVPRCAAPIVGDHVFTSTACSVCSVSENDCECMVSCDDGFAPFPEAAAYSPKKLCTEVAATVKAQACEGLDKENCLQSAEEGQPCGFTEAGECLPKGSTELKATDREAQFTKLRSYQWEAMPECRLLCSNTFAAHPALEEVGDCSTCFAGAENAAACEKQCSVECGPGTKFVEGSGRLGPQSCDEEGNFGEVPNCVPVTPSSENPKCPAPPNPKGTLVQSKGCSACTAGESCDCEVSCAEGLLAVTPERLGQKDCLLRYASCPKLTEFDEGKGICKDLGTGKETDYLCCTEAWYSSPPEMKSGSCIEITDESQCLTTENNGHACCWFADGEKSAGDDPKVCVESGSDLIDDDHLPRACADRPAVKKYQWEEMPECAAKCKNDFKYVESVVTKDCDECHGHEHNDCDCTVECAPGLDYYGRAPLGPRKCDSRTGSLGGFPLCMAKPKPPVCTLFVEPEVYALTDCHDCVAGDTENCHCEIHCNTGYTHEEGSRPEGPIQCMLLEKTLHRQGLCKDASGQSDCMTWSEGGQPCCWLGGTCVQKGSEDLVAPPQSCADDPEESWPVTPVCLAACSYHYIANLADEFFFDYDGCYGCVAGDKGCKCQVQCRSGYVRVAGGEEGYRSCTPGDVEFRNPPLCMRETMADPAPECWHYQKGQNVETSDCGQCKADDQCWCKATCKQGTSPIGGTTEGPKACIQVDNALTDVSETGGCASLTDRASCLASAEMTSDVTCCWNALEGWCKPQFAEDMSTPPDQCAPLYVGQWEDVDNPLECEVACTHSFPTDGSYSYDHEACNSCLAGNDCKCNIECAAGYERVGGGSEGARSCTTDDSKFEAAPICMKKFPAPLCPAISEESPEYIATGCDKCRAGEDCSCSVTCAAGYTLRGAHEEVVCEAVEADLTISHCETLYYDDCIKSKEGDAPCCYKSHRFGFGGTCLPKGSPEMEKVPDKCAETQIGQWKGLPTCRPVCPNIFKDLPHVVQEDCDDCAVGEDCKCTARCEDGFVAMNGDEGTQTCGISVLTGKTEFLSPPQCKQQCKVPDTEQGTLDVSQCREPCLPGESCSCKVFCAKHNSRIGGGAEGKFLRCQEEAGIAVFKGMPKCLPQCSRPDDQAATLNTQNCASTCDAGTECSCNLRCHGEHKGGGPEGDRECMFFPGEGSKPAIARWVNVDADECQGKTSADLPQSCQELPVCMSPFVVTVKDARSKRLISGAKIRLVDIQGVVASQEAISDANGEAAFQTGLVDLKIEVHKDCEGEVCYLEWQREFDRLKMCRKASKCGKVVVPLSRKLDSGDIASPGCYLILQNNYDDETGTQLLDFAEQRWTMQATLSWGETPKDLDLWVRKYECQQQINERFGCDETSSKRMRKACAEKRHKMLWDSAQQRVEREACGKFDCLRDEFNADATEEVLDLSDLKRVCTHAPGWSEGGPVFNQYHKWVMHGSRLCKNLDKSLTDIVNKGGTLHGKYRRNYAPHDAHRDEIDEQRCCGWNLENWMILDTDERNGWGPETVTFHNVPPGVYQVVVDVWQPGDGEVADIRQAKPRVEITLGSMGVKVVCEPPPECTSDKSLWHAADIHVLDAGIYEKDPSKRKYSIRVQDNPPDMLPVYRFEQPSESFDNEAHSQSKHRKLDPSYVFSEYKRGKTEYVFYKYWPNKGNGYSSLEMKSGCSGGCRIEEGFEDYEACLANPEAQREQRGSALARQRLAVNVTASRL